MFYWRSRSNNMPVPWLNHTPSKLICIHLPNLTILYIRDSCRIKSNCTLLEKVEEINLTEPNGMHTVKKCKSWKVMQIEWLFNTSSSKITQMRLNGFHFVVDGVHLVCIENDINLDKLFFNNLKISEYFFERRFCSASNCFV